MLFCLINLPQCWQIWQVLKLVLRPAVCLLGLMCQRGGLKSSPCSPTGTQQSPQANISWHFPWQHGTISALSTTVGERLIAVLPSNTIFSPDKINLYDACQCVCSCVLLCLSGTWNFKLFLTSCWKAELHFSFFLFFFASNSSQMCFARWNIPLWCHLQKALVQF